LTVSPPAADFVLIPTVSRFLAVYPEITLDISINSAPVDLVAEHFDAGIRRGDELARDMIAVRIGGKMPIVVAAAPAYLACFGEPKMPHDLAAHNCTRCRKEGGAFWPWRFRVNGRVLDVHVGGRLIINDRTSGLKTAIDGVGLTQMPLPYLASELTAGRLVTVLNEYAPPPVEPIFLYYSSRRYMRPALKALLAFPRAMGRDGAH
jgi:DNA-binding transcriptional LysR family regulator